MEWLDAKSPPKVAPLGHLLGPLYNIVCLSKPSLPPEWTMTDLPANLQVNNILGVGNALFTSTAIDPGAEIFHVDRPLVSVLNQGHLKTACSNCFVWLPENGTDGGAIVQKSVGGRGKQQVKKLRACQGCKIVRYCSTVGSWE